MDEHQCDIYIPDSKEILQDFYRYSKYANFLSTNILPETLLNRKMSTIEVLSVVNMTNYKISHEIFLFAKAEKRRKQELETSLEFEIKPFGEKT